MDFPRSNAGWANLKKKKKNAPIGTPVNSNRVNIPRAGHSGNETLLIFYFVS